jgi:hypothetical protein
MFQIGEFTVDDGRLMWREVHTHELSDTGCIYLCRRASDMPHIVYKLSKAPESHGCFWSGMWNTCAHSGPEYKTLQEAIQSKLDEGWEVRRCIFSDVFNSPFGRA